MASLFPSIVFLKLLLVELAVAESLSGNCRNVNRSRVRGFGSGLFRSSYVRGGLGGEMGLVTEVVGLMAWSRGATPLSAEVCRLCCL